jgi:EmrB/QacA subfamily drug resistance transporter
VLLVVGGGYSLLQSLVVPALPTLQRDLHTDAPGVAWVFTSFLLASCVATPIAGRLGDLFGKKRLLVVALVGLAVGTLLSALSTSLAVMLVGRVIQGLGAAIFPLAFGIIRDQLPRERVAFGIAAMTGVLGMGGVIGIVLAGPILEHLSYHWLFWIPMIATLIALAATIMVVPESDVRASGSLSWLSALLFSGWLVCLLFAISKAPEWGWASGRVLGLAAVAAVVAAAWARSEQRARHPFVDLRVLNRGGSWTTHLAALLLGMGLYSGFVLLPQFVQAPTATGYGLGLSVTKSGLFLLPWTGTMLFASALSARLSAVAGPRRPLAVGAAVGAGGFAFLATENAEKWELLLASGLIGAGVGLAFSAVANLVVASVPPTETGVASGVNIIARTLGGAVGTQIAVSIVATTVGDTGFATRDGYVWVFAISAAMLVVAWLTALRAPSGLASRHHESRELAPGG